MTSNHAPLYKAYTGNNKTDIVVPISSYSLVQKLPSSIFLMVLWVSSMLSTTGFSCGPKSSHPPKGMEFGHKVSRLPHPTTRCVGSVTVFGMGNPADYIMVDHTPLCQQSKWQKGLSPIIRSLYGQGCIAPEQSMYQYVIDHGNYGNVTSKWCNIDPNPDPSDNIAARHPMDDAIPNWEGYGLTRLRSYQGLILNDTHTFSLDLGETKFQNGEQLGFILVKPNVALVDLVKHLLEKCASWSDQPHVCTEDYLILPGVISEHELHDSNAFNSFTKLNLNSYSHLYFYIKKNHHYCFIPLENTVSAVTMAYPAFSRSYEDILKSEQAGPSSLESNVAALPESPSSLKQGEPLDTLPKANGPLAEDRPINKHTNGESRPTSLSEELKAASYKTTVSAVTTAYSTSSRSYEDILKSEQAGPSSLESNVAALPESPSSLKQSEPLGTLPKANGPLAEDRPINKHTNGESRPINLLEELKAASYNPIGSKMGHHSALSETFQGTEIAQEEALEIISKHVKTFKSKHEYATKLITQTKIMILNVTKNKISLSWGNKIQSALSSALEKIQSLHLALNLEKEYQLGIQYSRPTNLSKQRKAAVQTLENLQTAIQSESRNMGFITTLLNEVIGCLDEICTLLPDIKRSLFRSDKTGDMRRSVKQLFIGNSIQLKKGQDIIAQLEQMEGEQLEMIQNFQQTTLEISEILEGILKELATSIHNPLEVVKNKICSSDLKLKLKLESNIVEGRVENPERIKNIITDLELEKEDIQEVQAILNRLDVASGKKIEQKIEEAFNKAVDLKVKLKTEILLKVKEIVNQSELLMNLY